MSPLLKNLVIALGITLVVAVVYYALPSDTTSVPEVGIDVASDISTKSVELLAEKQKLESINLEKKMEFFNDKKFTSLKNTRIELRQENIGRGNPFESVQ